MYQNLYLFVLFVSVIYCDDCPPCKCENYYTSRINCADDIVEFRNPITTIPIVNYTESVDWDELIITHQPLKSLPANAFQNAELTSLGYISINYCDINAVHEEAFNNVSYLVTLKLSYNNLFELPDSIFKPTIYIKYLDLSYNKFKSFNNKIFADLTLLENLEIGNNLLTTFNENALLTNKKLKILNLSYNKLTSLNITMIKTIKTFNILKIVGNPLTCDCFIKDLYIFIINKYKKDKSNYQDEVSNTICRAPQNLQVSWRSWNISEDNFKCWLNSTALEKKAKAKLGETITLSCIVDSNTLPTVIWIHNNEQITVKSNKYHLKTTIVDQVTFSFNLSILNLSEEDKGFYKCILYNNLTVSKAKIKLVVEKGPINVFFIFIIVGFVIIALGCIVILFKCAIKCSINIRITADQTNYEENFKMDDFTPRTSRVYKS